MRFTLFFAILFVYQGSSLAADAVVDSSLADCSGVVPKSVRPLYPPQALRDKKEGNLVVEVWIDRCGRVLKSELLKSTPNALLNAAALDAANKSIFIPGKDVGAASSRIEVPYVFKADKTEYKSEKVVWPSSHRKAFFVLDESPMQFETVEEAKAKIGSESFRLLSARRIQQMLQLKNENGDIWLFLADNASYKFKVAARYHRVPAEKPTVSVQVLCDPLILDCGKMKATLLKSGLPPFAKSLND